MSNHTVKLTLEQISIVRSWAITTFQGYEMPNTVLDLLNRLDASERLSEGNQDAVDGDSGLDVVETSDSDEIEVLRRELALTRKAIIQLVNELNFGTVRGPAITFSQRNAIIKTLAGT